MSACIVCGAPAPAPNQRVHLFEGQWLAASDGPPVCQPQCAGLESTDAVCETREEREFHGWLCARVGQERRGQAVPPWPSTAIGRLVDSHFAIARLKWGWAP